jgi:hypothetical protein
MGLPADYSKPGEVDEHPPENFAEGCPGGWYRSPFLQSLRKYMRHDGRNNPLLDSCEDELVQEAIVYFEEECARAREMTSMV